MLLAVRVWLTKKFPQPDDEAPIILLYKKFILVFQGIRQVVQCPTGAPRKHVARSPRPVSGSEFQYFRGGHLPGPIVASLQQIESHARR
jgi:hypothetical protein